MDANLALTHFTSSAVVVYAMNKLKAASWFPLLQEGKVWLNRGVSMVTAAAIALAINYTWNPSTRLLTITIPTLTGLLLAFWHWLNQYVMQETLHQVTSQRTQPAVVFPAAQPGKG
jgi:hypothetical protein